MESELIRHAYPVTFGRSMNFTLPAVASGPSIEADVDGAQIVFPLGPELPVVLGNLPIRKWTRRDQAISL